MTGVGDDSRGRLLGRPWFVVGLALALAATLALVLADDIRYLRLGIVAALWAALVGAFLAVKYRKSAASTEEAVAQAQEVYELELEREIAARREYELEIEAETRSRVQADSRNELDALRAEVSALRDNLQSLFGGEVLLERVALTAQATRMRALREEQRVVEPASGNGNRTPAQLTAAPTPPKERPTQFMDRVREKQPARAGGRPAAPEPRRPERSLDLPPRRPPNNDQPLPNRTSAASSISKAAAEARAEQTRVQAPATPPREQRRDTRAESTRPAFSPSERARRAKAEKPEPEPVEEPTKMSKPVDADWTPSWEGRFNRDRGENGNTAPKTPEPAPARHPEPVVARAEPVKPPEEELPSPSNPTLPVEVRRAAQEARGGGRRRRSEDESPAETSGGGRRRRAEGEPPSWGTSNGGQHSGSHAKPDMSEVRRGESSGYQAPIEPPRRTGESSGYRNAPPRRSGESSGYRAAPQAGRRSGESSGYRAVPESNGRRVAESSGYRPALEEGTPTGSHASGRSVSDLLKAHGTTDAIPRRRRRAED
ncbi:DUF6779 domain-containing protein [Amycolatopsis sp.]|uniref:DUF6779 domain-containing protein n=1 Tax=Amycolatopsis sp. TaxID=37632 RepID=UPI002B895A41|nr:DUF6779 domain-containing protein [Amycolatopsis sp.]HVV12340.1 DUF6779 domain-containing protein [Amycolatopsis sp.]